MNISNYVTSSFSPFEMAVANRILTAVCIVALIFLIKNSAPNWAFGLVSIDYVLLSVGFWYFSRCPSCRKPADTEYFFSEHSIWGYFERNFHFGRWSRLWPDRECSECRYQLDQISDHYRD